METGTIIKSTTFNNNPYWTVKCDNQDIEGSKNGELPINPLSMPVEWDLFMGRWYHMPLLNRNVKFLVEMFGNENYATIIY